jgi:cysteine desulfurase/selenocysteine lyase
VNKTDISIIDQSIKVPKAFDVQTVRKDFPLLNKRVGKHPLIYFDNAATTQKPQCVIDQIHYFYTSMNANIHRGVHQLSEEASEAYEQARKDIAVYINAQEAREVVLVKGATEGFNLIAQTWGKKHLKAGDEILISLMEHHANIIPWQLLCEEIGCQLRFIPITAAGELDLEAFERLLNPRVKLLSLVHASNTLGTLNPIQYCIDKAKQRGITVIIDGAQSIAHVPIDVQALGCDFFVFSGHKVFAPTGIGVVYGNLKTWQDLPPYQGGGGMIQKVTIHKTYFKPAPDCYEAGTPPISAAIALARALAYLKSLDMQALVAYENKLLDYATECLSHIPVLKIIGTAAEKVPVISFIIDGIHPHDVGTILNQEGIAIRTGHHCTQPLLQHLGLPGTCRASLAFYNTVEEIEVLKLGIQKTIRLFH